MATDSEIRAVKRQKLEKTMDPQSNPYLAHMYQTPQPPSANGSGLKSFKRHATTATQAMAAEDGPANPFTGRNLSKRYFDILKVRRNLPVHAQRYVDTSQFERLSN